MPSSFPHHQNNYYDIDAILAEEELVPCTTNFDFSFLGHLDPDRRLNGSNNDDDDDSNNNEKNLQPHYLPEKSRIKLPLWALQQSKWAKLDFVSVGLPRHYQRKARERLEAAPSEVNLRKRNERFFLSGRFLVDLFETSVYNVSKSTKISSNRREKLEHLAQEAKKLRNTLLMTYTGERLRQTLDWSLSSVGDDDVTVYTNQLSEMERRLFRCGAVAASSHLRWRVYGKRRWLIQQQQQQQRSSSAASTTLASNGKRSNAARPVTPHNLHDNEENNTASNNNNNKRQRRQY